MSTNSQTAIIYMRLSKDDKYDESLSISNQRDLISAFCANRDIEVVKEFVDATDIIGLKQNPTNGRRFSPIFSFIGYFFDTKRENATSKAKEEN